MWVEWNIITSFLRRPYPESHFIQLYGYLIPHPFYCRFNWIIFPVSSCINCSSQLQPFSGGILPNKTLLYRRQFLHYLLSIHNLPVRYFRPFLPSSCLPTTANWKQGFSGWILIFRSIAFPHYLEKQFETVAISSSKWTARSFNNRISPNPGKFIFISYCGYMEEDEDDDRHRESGTKIKQPTKGFVSTNEGYGQRKTKGERIGGSEWKLGTGFDGKLHDNQGIRSEGWRRGIMNRVPLSQLSNKKSIQTNPFSVFRPLLPNPSSASFVVLLCY